MVSSQALGPHHIAFLRAWFQGLDLRQAWGRYMAFSDPVGDLRHIQRRRREILATLLHQGHQLDLTLPPTRKLTAALSLLAREPFTPATAPLPSLDDFADAQGLEPDLYSQAELLQLFKAHYGIDGLSSSADSHDGGPSPERTLNEQVRALNQVATWLTQAPSPDDRLDRWLAPRLAERLKAAGVGTLQRLVGFINLHGRHWHRRVAGVGATRARALTRWLQSVQAPFKDQLRHEVVEHLAGLSSTSPIPVTPPADVVEAPRFGLVPWLQLQVPPALSGHQGLFRSHMPNTLGAEDDRQAIERWLAKYRERPHTWRSYQREAERFYLWCVIERGKPLSSIDALDCQAYRDFLAHLPPGWIQPRRTGGLRPADHVWRPFRGPLSPASQKLALVIVQTLFQGLQSAGYLVANPMAAVMKGFNLPAGGVKVERSFTQAEWGAVRAAVDQEPPSPARTRLRLLLALLGATGLRLDEVASAELAGLRQVPVDGEAEPAWVLRVTGKRRKVRDVPVPDPVVRLVEDHHREAWAAQGLTAVGRGNAPAAGIPVPLIQALAPPVRRRPQAAPSSPAGLAVQLPHVAASAGPTAAGLGRHGIHAVLKRFFRRLATRDIGLDPQRLQQASAHWLRHTFGRQALAAQVPLEVVQQALGHASLSTTTIYVTTERSRMIRELRKLQRDEDKEN